MHHFDLETSPHKFEESPIIGIHERKKSWLGTNQHIRLSVVAPTPANNSKNQCIFDLPAGKISKDSNRSKVDVRSKHCKAK